MSLVITKMSGHWRGSFSGTGEIGLGPNQTKICLPKEFGGRGVDTTPEDLIVSALGSCYMITLGIILDMSNIKYESLEIETELRTKKGNPPTIFQAVLRPRIVTNADREVIQKMLQVAEEKCLVSQAIDGNIEKIIEPQILSPQQLNASEEGLR